MDPVILASVRKHGGHRRRHAARLQDPVRVFALEDLTMLVGPDQSARVLEIGVATAEGIEFIVHAMPARPKFVR